MMLGSDGPYSLISFHNQSFLNTFTFTIPHRLMSMHKTVEPRIGKIDDLASSSCLNVVPKCVWMDEVAIFEPSEKFEALYTQGAGPCGILIMIARSEESGKISAIALAHVGPLIYENSITKIFALLNSGKDSSIEAYVIGGCDYNHEKIFRAVVDKGVEVKFAWANPLGDRSDAAVVDSCGRVYYGKLLDPGVWKGQPSGTHVRKGGQFHVIDLRIPTAQNRVSMELNMKKTHNKVMPIVIPEIKEMKEKRKRV